MPLHEDNKEIPICYVTEILKMFFFFLAKSYFQMLIKQKGNFPLTYIFAEFAVHTFIFIGMISQHPEVFR